MKRNSLWSLAMYLALIAISYAGGHGARAQTMSSSPAQTSGYIYGCDNCRVGCPLSSLSICPGIVTTGGQYACKSRPISPNTITYTYLSRTPCPQELLLVSRGVVTRLKEIPDCETHATALRSTPDVQAAVCLEGDK